MSIVTITAASPAAVPSATDWVRSACSAAFDLPAHGAEWELWAVRGLSEVALGCLLLDDPPAAAAELDEIVRGSRLGATGPAAGRLRRVRALLGPVPDGYPSAQYAPPRRPGGPDTGVWAAAEALCVFCTGLLDGLGGRSPRTCGGCAAPYAGSAAGALRWGAGLRPSPAPCAGFRIARSPGPGLVWRSWMRLPCDTGPGIVVVERPPVAPLLSRLVWRGLHDGAHLDHMAELARTDPAAPLPIEFGAGLLLTEAYAMATEMIAAAELAPAGDAPVVGEICRGLLERVGRLPGAASRPGLEPAAAAQAREYGGLPTLAAAYVAGPLRLLAGGTGLPPGLAAGLRHRWERVVERSGPAARLDRAARALC